MIHYIIVRRDLSYNRHGKFGKHPGKKSPLGTTAAQVTHAAGESFAEFIRHLYGVGGHFPNKHEDEIANQLEREPTIAVVLGVSNERRLKALEKKLREAKIQHVPIHEPDAPWNGQLMTIGLWPCDRSLQTEKILGRLKLL